MDSYTSMKQKLLPTGIYDIKKGSAVDCELKAYAEGIDSLFSELDEMTDECFISTAKTYGISEREKFTGKVRGDLPLEKRKEMLMIAEQRMGSDGSPSGFRKFLEGCGLVDFELIEVFNNMRLTISINDNLSDSEKKLIEEKAVAEAPVHLSVTFRYPNSD